MGYSAGGFPRLIELTDLFPNGLRQRFYRLVIAPSGSLD